MATVLQGERIDVARRKELFELSRASGGYASFEGVVRDSNHGQAVSYLTYEAYEPMAAKEIRRVLDEAKEKFSLHACDAVHRVGTLQIGDTAVMIQVAGAHRDECFAGCRFVIDEIKKRVPIWKHEFYVDGTSDWTRCNH